MRRRALRSLGGDRRGATLVEFAIVSPVFLMLLVGILDIAHGQVLRAVLQGALQKSGRDSTLEANATTANQAIVDKKVRDTVGGLAFGQPITFKRRFYRTFERAAAAQAEPYTDGNANGRCDNGEQYMDNNLNTVWDADGADAGQGFAFDKAVYSASITYPRLFPLWRFVGGDSTATASARTVLMNQPYVGQGSYGTAAARNCP